MGERLCDRVVIVGWDGLRPDLVAPELTPNLCGLIERGVRWSNSSAVFPSETRPNNAAIGTGCFPGKHGITANKMLVPEVIADGPFDCGNHNHLFALEKLEGRMVAVPTLGAVLARHGLAMVAIGSGSPGQTLLQNADPVGGWAINPGFTRPEELGFTIPIKMGMMPRPAPRDSRCALDDYLARIGCDYAVPELDPAVLVIWSGEPDIALHAFGLGSERAAQAIRDNDARLGRTLDQLLDSPRRTAVLFLSDHGHSTVRGRINLSRELVAAGLKESVKSDDAVAIGAGVRLSEAARDRLPRLVDFLASQPWCGPIFVRDDRWSPSLGGTLPASSLWDGEPGRWVPDVQFSCAWDDEPNERGIPGQMFVPSTDGTALTSHGSLSPRDMGNVLVLSGPGLKQGLTIEAPAAVVDVAPTVLDLLGLDPAPEMQGRVLSEARDAREPAVSLEPLGDGRWGRLVRRRVGSTGYVAVE
jgi:phosphonoacetate hydrolase